MMHARSRNDRHGGQDSELKPSSTLPERLMFIAPFADERE
jgi:hypothetical protein